MGASIPADRTAYFIHVMKTGGTSFVQHAVANLPTQSLLPPPRTADHVEGEGLYAKAEGLRSLTDEDRAAIRFCSGHWPYAARELVGADFTLTVLRHPVDRTISFLHHARRHHPRFRDRSLVDIYGDWHQFGYFIWDYQVRQFAKTIDDDLDHIGMLFLDDERLELAKANLDQVDVVGLHDRYDEWEREAVEALGWPYEPVPRLRVTDGRADAAAELPESFIERVTVDNAYDIQFYEYAVDLHERRHAGPDEPAAPAS